MNQDDNSIPLLTEVIPVTSPQVLPTQAMPDVSVPSGYFDQSHGNHFGGPDYGAATQPGAFHTQPSATSYVSTPFTLPDPIPFQGPTTSMTSIVPMQEMPEVLPTPAAEQYRQWEQEIRENVLQSLLEQADTVLQQHLQDQMAVVLDNLSDILTQHIKEKLQLALAETVTRAVAEEMARFASSQK